MPSSEEFVVRCLFLADFDVRCTLQGLLARDEDPFDPMTTRGSFRNLLRSAPGNGAGASTWRTDEEMATCILDDVALGMLGFWRANVGENDDTWRPFAEDAVPERVNRELRGLLSTDERLDPLRLKKRLLEILFRFPRDRPGG